MVWEAESWCSPRVINIIGTEVRTRAQWTLNAVVKPAPPLSICTGTFHHGLTKSGPMLNTSLRRYWTLAGTHKGRQERPLTDCLFKRASSPTHKGLGVEISTPLAGHNGSLGPCQNEEMQGTKNTGDEMINPDPGSILIWNKALRIRTERKKVHDRLR